MDTARQMMITCSGTGRPVPEHDEGLRMSRNFRYSPLLVVLLTGLLCSRGEAGLRDIRPRPQQMGTLSTEPAYFSGMPTIVTPNNPTPAESRVHDEAIRIIGTALNRYPVVIPWSSSAGVTPAIWMGTLARMPQLAAALDSVGIAGLGSTSRSEEYQLVVQNGRILLGAADTQGLRWGLMSLVRLMSEVYGRLYVDRVYIRDWPDFTERIGTVNTNLREASELTWAENVVDLSYGARMNQIEFNSMEAGRTTTYSWVVARMQSLASRIRNNEMLLSMSCDRYGQRVSVTLPHWQEGVPIRNFPMRVGTTGFETLATGYGITVPNGNFESWSGSRPSNWTMYRDDRFNFVSRDNVIRHSGASSVKFSGFSASSPNDCELRQTMYVGARRMLNLKFWYKTSGYNGSIRIDVFGTGTPTNRFQMKYVRFTTPTTVDWTLVETPVCTFGADSIYLIIGAQLPTAGTLWIDDIVFEAGDMTEMVRRLDTPLEVTSRRTGQLMTEGMDYRAVETHTTSYDRYLKTPRLERVSGSRLALGDTVYVNWSSAYLFIANQTHCFSQLEPLLEYQSRIRTLDSMMRPDRFNIQINEVSYTNYDHACTSRNLTPGRIVGRFCNQLYQIIQSQRPGARVRSYGDAFDIWVNDPRAMPVQSGVPWPTGALQELGPGVDIMAMLDYSSNIDSSLAYIGRSGNRSVIADALWMDFSRLVSGVSKATRYPFCVGVQIYMWPGDADADFPWKIPAAGDLGWNIGPYIIHSPQRFELRPDSIRIDAEMWSDAHYTTTTPAITSATLRYRLLPSGTWTTVNLNPAGTDHYRFTVGSITAAITGMEYYLTAIDHRSQTTTAPADAPARVYAIMWPPPGGPSGAPGGEAVEFSLRTIGNSRILQWEPKEGVLWYEIHNGRIVDSPGESKTLLSRQSPDCPQFLLGGDKYKTVNSDSLRVYAVRPRGQYDPEQTAIRRRP